MSNKSIEGCCILCTEQSVYNQTDFGNRRFYSCTNPKCGEYEISLGAMGSIENNETLKQALMPMAHGCRNTDQMLEIILVGSGVESSIVKRPNS